MGSGWGGEGRWKWEPVREPAGDVYPKILVWAVRQVTFVSPTQFLAYSECLRDFAYRHE